MSDSDDLSDHDNSSLSQSSPASVNIPKVNYYKPSFCELKTIHQSDHQRHYQVSSIFTQMVILMHATNKSQIPNQDSLPPTEVQIPNQESHTPTKLTTRWNQTRFQQTTTSVEPDYQPTNNWSVELDTANKTTTSGTRHSQTTTSGTKSCQEIQPSYDGLCVILLFLH
ncbi:unnamed protein product [Mytilus coruscus]|uniref:Uncharacterized protein n=1 Tax=Mytilus coruscus TaxID=42192 RepID=A0A6J8DRF8_MYTCO|nr:unnamed protein product [Mytilus coruscus]